MASPARTKRTRYVPTRSRYRLPLSLSLSTSLNSFRRDFEHPGENQSNRKSDNQKQYHQPHRPIRNFEKRKDLRGDLDQQPTDNRVSDSNLVKLRRFSSAKNSSSYGRAFAHENPVSAEFTQLFDYWAPILAIGPLMTRDRGVHPAGRLLDNGIWYLISGAPGQPGKGRRDITRRRINPLRIMFIEEKKSFHREEVSHRPSQSFRRDIGCFDHAQS